MNMNPRDFTMWLRAILEMSPDGIDADRVSMILDRLDKVSPVGVAAKSKDEEDEEDEDDSSIRPRC